MSDRDDGLLLRDVEIEGRVVDVRVAGGRVEEVGPGLTPQSPAAEVVDGRGGALLPGLHDHHLHLLALAASSTSLDLATPGADWREALRTAEPTHSGWVRAIGYHDDQSLDRDSLDAIRSDVPVRVQHRGGALWVLNSRALELVLRHHVAGGGPLDLGVGVERDASGRPTGRLWRRDDLVRAVAGGDLPMVGPVTTRLRELGLTGVTDASPGLSPQALEHLAGSLADGPSMMRLTVLAAPSTSRLPAGVFIGPMKIHLPDHDLPRPDEIADRIREARSLGRAVAVHCVTRQSLLLTLMALDEVGAVDGDRIEHGSVVPPELADWVARLRLRVVTQPLLLRERGDDYLREVETPDVPHLYPYAALLARGVRVAPSSDAPHASPDPWAALAAARDRLSSRGVRVGSDRPVSLPRVLEGYLSPALDPGGPPRRVRRGVPADLCLLHVPLSSALVECSADVVRRTFVEGG